MEQYESIKSKERVKELGEVFTPDGIVKDMLDLDGVKEYSYDLDKTFLEPSCGTGNFLVEIVARKCKTAVSESKIEGSEQVDIDKLKINLLKAVATVYGVDIMPDNVNESRNRIINDIVAKKFEETTENSIEEHAAFKDAVEYIVNRNIVWGNTLEWAMHPEFINDGQETIVPKRSKEYKLRKKGAFKGKSEDIADQSKDVAEMEFSTWEFKADMVTRTAYIARLDNSISARYEEVPYTKIESAKLLI